MPVPDPAAFSLWLMAPAAAIVAVLAAMAAAEWIWPDRAAARRERWLRNFGLGLFNAAMVRIIGVAAPASAGAWVSAHDVGMFQWLNAPLWAVLAGGIILMDLAIYGQHRALHSTGWGWALHRLHHADAAMDVSTAVRFNPAEALVSMLYKSLLTLILGLPLVAVLAFEAWLAIGSAIEHANVRVPPRADAALRRFWVTPAMHRVHHSAHGDDHNHNYGFALSIWDRMFGTYRAAAAGQQIGLSHSHRAG
jgi:sterol desaturase/sphingolipid hydroxylase (fatty acid hydroxylase superfamily)